MWRNDKNSVINITWNLMQSFFEPVINYLNDGSQEKNKFLFP